MNTDELGFVQAIKEQPGDVASRLAYADWLEEQNRGYEAFQQRVKAGVSEARCKLRRKSDGLFSQCEGRHENWSTQGKVWRAVSGVQAHLRHHGGRSAYFYNTPWDDLEIVVFEVRVQFVANIPLSLRKTGFHNGPEIVVDEPKGTSV